MTKSVVKSPRVVEQCAVNIHSPIKISHKDFQKLFVDNPFGHRCSICETLGFTDDLRSPVAERKNSLLEINLEDIKECYNDRQSLSRKSIPNLSKYNSFVNPEIPAYFPTLNLVSEIRHEYFSCKLGD
ncbi:uncharacterized protein TNCV_4345091 [Trichonephila clavipes]|nr:uncharacterized protein TNCV_4345091 [Trichonephila clavipes]